MKFKSLFLTTTFLTLFFGFLLPKTALATTFTLSGNISDSTGSYIENATVNVINPSNNTSVGNTTTSSEGNYSLAVNEGTYNVQVTPPSGSGFTSAIALSQNISSDKTLNFVLVPAGSLVFSGHAYDSLGNAASGISIELWSNNGQTFAAGTTTDSSGKYSVTVPAGTYTIFYTKSPTNNSPNFPDSARIFARNYVLSQSTVLDITFPLKQVQVHVQDSSGNPVGNAALNTTSPNIDGGLNIGGGITNASGSDQDTASTDPVTGNAVLWLLPTTYGITITPPSGSGYLTTSQNVNVTGDTNLTITLQQPAVLSGHVHDALGNLAPGINIELWSNNGQTLAASTITDSSGKYSVTVSPGTYTIFYTEPQSNNLPNFPDSARIFARNYVLSQSTVLDITFPLKRVQIHLQDAFGNAIGNVGLNTTSPNIDGGLNIGGGITSASGSDQDTASTDPVTGNAVLWLLPTTYGITATPPSGSGYLTTSQNVNVTGDTNLTMVLTQPVALSGHVYDALGNAVTGITVQMWSNNGQTLAASTITDSSGKYSVTVSAGTYTIFYAKSQGNYIANFPTSATVFARNYVLSQSTVLDITFPLKQVQVHVQDAYGNSIGNVRFKTTSPNIDGGLNIGGGIIDASGNDQYLDGDVATDPVTGNAVLWLLPTTYGITATPPSGSIYNTFSITRNITTDQSLLISLQYNHATPTTTANLATQHTDGTYSNPTTVTLSATADSGYTIANTYYTVDGGSQQTYTAPFDVPGSGDHVVTYWSVDNSGVSESHHTKSFTIHTNQVPFVNPISSKTINEGSTYTQDDSFSDDDSTSWTATVDYGEGAGPVNLPLDAGKTFSLSHQYATPGIYTVAVVVTDNQGATGTTMATITVNAKPKINGLTDSEVNYQDDFIETGSFTDSDSSSWTGTVDYGDGLGLRSLVLNPDHSFVLDNTYPAVGVYMVTVTIIDNQGAAGTASLTVKVNAPPHINPLSGNTLNEGGTYTENDSFFDTDSTSWTGTVNYGDGSGVQNLALNNDDTFSLSHLYKDNGTYTVSVSITDNQGAIGTKTATVTVNNVNPAIGSITASVNPIQVNSSTTATASFTDTGVLDTHTAVWNWGDGTTSNGTVTETNGSGSVSDSHIYSVAGVYPITLTVTDKDNGVGTQTFQYLSVYDPTPQGLFSAGQKFTSPAGAYTQNPNMTGTVLFGLSYKYQGTMPSGNRQFSLDFNQANFHFNATSVSSLVISNGIGTLTGTGTVNGTGTYTFLVTGSESADTIRIKIKDQSGNVIYDTQPQAADNATPITSLTAGNILAH